jgi:hypothetical protein
MAAWQARKKGLMGWLAYMRFKANKLGFYVLLQERHCYLSLRRHLCHLRAHATRRAATKRVVLAHEAKRMRVSVAASLNWWREWTRTRRYRTGAVKVALTRHNFRELREWCAVWHARAVARCLLRRVFRNAVAAWRDLMAQPSHAAMFQCQLMVFAAWAAWAKEERAKHIEASKELAATAHRRALLLCVPFLFWRDEANRTRSTKLSAEVLLAWLEVAMVPHRARRRRALGAVGARTPRQAMQAATCRRVLTRLQALVAVRADRALAHHLRRHAHQALRGWHRRATIVVAAGWHLDRWRVRRPLSKSLTFWRALTARRLMLERLEEEATGYFHGRVLGLRFRAWADLCGYAGELRRYFNRWRRRLDLARVSRHFSARKSLLCLRVWRCTARACRIKRGGPRPLPLWSGQRADMVWTTETPETPKERVQGKEEISGYMEDIWKTIEEAGSGRNFAKESVGCEVCSSAGDSSEEGGATSPTSPLQPELKWR